MKTLFPILLIASVIMFMVIEAATPPGPPGPPETSASKKPPVPPKTAAPKKPPPPKTADGDDCSESSECENGLCEAGQCTDPCKEKATGKENDEDCSDNDECKSRVCDQDKCIALPGCPPPLYRFG